VAEKIQCLMELATKCKKSSGLRSEDFFYANVGKNFNKQKKLHICKECMEQYIGDMSSVNKDRARVKAMELFQFLDIAYNHDAFMNATSIGAYMRHYTLKSTGTNNAWKDSTFPTTDDMLDVKNVTAEQDTEWMMFWGEGYSFAEYRYLDEEYERMCFEYEKNDYSQEILFKQICITQLLIRRAQATGIYNDKLIKQLQDLLGSANLKPSQQSLLKNTVNSLGVAILKYENEKPIAEPRDEFKDVNGIKKYIKSEFGHLAKMLGLNDE
jgi:hypothetical protein